MTGARRRSGLEVAEPAEASAVLGLGDEVVGAGDQVADGLPGVGVEADGGVSMLEARAASRPIS